MYNPGFYYVLGGYFVAFVTAFAIALQQYYEAVFGEGQPRIENSPNPADSPDHCANRELPEITYCPPARIALESSSSLLAVSESFPNTATDYFHQLQNTTTTTSRRNSVPVIADYRVRLRPAELKQRINMDNHNTNNTGSNEKLLPSAPASTSPFPPDVSLGVTNEKTSMAAAAAAAAAARHTELLQAQQAAAMRQAAHGHGGAGSAGPHQHPDDSLSDFDKLGVAMPHARTEDISKFGTLLLSAISILLVLITLPFSLCYCVKVVQEYERAVIFRLGRLKKGGASGPGLFFILPCIDNYRCVDLRTVSYEVPPQEMLSRDSVTVSVDAVCFYKISNPLAAVCNVGNYTHSTNLLVATSLRNVLGTKTLAEILSERETICHVMEHILDEATRPWGVKVERVEIKDVRVPVQLQRAMAAEAEAAREARAKVVAAEGEQKASTHLKEAALVLEESKSALQLRYLQTLNAISTEQSSTIVFPFPIDSLSLSMGVGKEKNKKE